MKDFIIRISLGVSRNIEISAESNLTWKEELSEEEHDKKVFTFNIYSNKGDLLDYFRIGRKINLSSKNSNFSKDFIISQISPFEGSDENEDYFRITAEDYASFIFSRNNVGLNLNTIEDEEYFEWLEENGLEGTVRDIITYILIRGRLYDLENDIGWKIEGQRKPLTYTIENGVWKFTIDSQHNEIRRALIDNEPIWIQFLVYNKRDRGKGRKRINQLPKRITAPEQLGKKGELVPSLAKGWVKINDKESSNFENMDLSDFAHAFISDLNYYTSEYFKGKGYYSENFGYYSKNFAAHGDFFREVAFIVKVGDVFLLDTISDWIRIYYSEYDNISLLQDYTAERERPSAKRARYKIYLKS